MNSVGYGIVPSACTNIIDTFYLVSEAGGWVDVKTARLITART